VRETIMSLLTDVIILQDTTAALLRSRLTLRALGGSEPHARDVPRRRERLSTGKRSVA